MDTIVLFLALSLIWDLTKVGKFIKHCSLFENYAGYARGWRFLIEFWNDSNFARINLKAPQHSTERTPPKNSNMIYYHKLERKVKTGLSLTKGSSILEPPFPLDPIAPGWNVIKQNNFPRFRNVICFCVFLVFFCVLSRKDAGWLQHLAKLIKLKVEMKHHDLYFSCIVETWREFYMNMRDNQIIENTLWDFLPKLSQLF